MELSPQQEALVENPIRTVIGVAGPGAGKTHTLRAKAMVTKVRYPFDTQLIMAFNQHSAADIKSKINDNQIEINTFHGFALSVIQRNRDVFSEMTGYSEYAMPTVCDEDTEKYLCISRLQAYQITKYPETKINLEWVMINYPKHAKEIVFQMREMGLIRYDELVPYATKIIENYPKVFRFNHVMIDEAQDSSLDQWQFIYAIERLPQVKQLLIIGDLDQTIHEWRGAKPELFLSAPDVLKADISPLTVSYRCPEIVCQAANNLIKNNSLRYDKKLKSGNDTAGEIIHKTFTNQDGYGEFYRMTEVMAGEIKTDLMEERTVAVLCRTNREVDFCVTQLTRMGIEAGRPGISKLNPITSGLLNFIETVIENQVVNQLSDAGIRLLDPADTYLSLKAKSTNQIYDVITILEEKYTWLKTGSVVDKAIRMEAFLRTKNSIAADEVRRIIDAMMELRTGTIIKSKAALIEILTEHETTARVRISTIHGAKGLEFDSVHIYNFSEETIPSKFSQNIEEERRLAYVAVTRTKNRLLFYSTKPSIFIEEMEIGKDLLQCR